MKTDLMVTISHEARTPLAVLSSYAGLVSMELKDKGVNIQAFFSKGQQIAAHSAKGYTSIFFKKSEHRRR